MGIEYSKGANMSQCQEALNTYNLNYGNYNYSGYSVMSWYEFRTNINNKYPVFVGAVSDDGEHAVVAYGYLVATGVRYVTLWDPGEYCANGDSITAVFIDSGTTFSSNNEIYQWTESISYY